MNSGDYVPLKVIAARQSTFPKISRKRHQNAWCAGGWWEASSGRGGGYRLLRSGDDYTVGEILRCTEGSLAPVACVEDNACARRGPCVACYTFGRGCKTPSTGISTVSH